ncbi:MAG: sugar transferase [Bacteroidota bacterium]
MSQLFDILAILCSVLLCSFLHTVNVIVHTPFDQSVPVLGIYTIVSMTLSSLLGLYRGSFHLSLRLQNFIVARSYLISIMITLAFVSLIKNLYIDRFTVFTFTASLPLFFLMNRSLLYWLNLYFQSKGFGVHNSIIVGYDNEGIKIADRFTSFPELGYKISGFLVKEKGRHPQLPDNLKAYPLEELENIIVTKNIDRIFIPSTEIIVNGFSTVKALSKKHGIKVKILSPLSEELLKIARIYDIAGITLTSQPRVHINKLKSFLKRTFDFFVGSLVVMILSPIFIFTIVAIFIESGKPIFFLQRRASIKGGKEFFFIKFRSMVSNAEELKEELRKENESDGALFKIKDDPRITRVGKFIRKFSIDELPQLFNVLKGDMSLVGPRPLPINDFENVDESDEFWEAIRDRANVKPGMTGIWQVSGRSNIKFREMILLDLYYVENHSILFDMELLFETIPTVLFGRGAY